MKRFMTIPVFPSGGRSAIFSVEGGDRAMENKRAKRLTPRQREWLRKLEACARSGETVRAHAKRHRVREGDVVKRIA